MRMDKLTSRFQQALADAQSLAVGRDNNMLEPAHLMAALLDQQGGSTVPLLAQAGVNVPSLRTRIGQALDADLAAATPGLYVCDASVIPEPWGLPPTLTLLCLGWRLGRQLARVSASPAASSSA